jgi:hypothetical protein
MTNYPEIPKLEYPKAEASDIPQKRPVRPWDIFNKNVEKVSNEIKDKRLSICLECPRLIKATKQCKECGCFMDVKAKLFDATCPLDKWDAVMVNRDQFDYKEG